MKKKFMITAAIVALALVGGYVGKVATDQADGLSEIQLANVEALALGEFIVGEGLVCFHNHYDDIDNPMFFTITECENCTTISAVYFYKNDHCTLSGMYN